MCEAGAPVSGGRARHSVRAVNAEHWPGRGAFRRVGGAHGMVRLTSGSHRVQGDAVAFAVVDHGAEAIGADGMLRLKHLAAVRLDRRDGLVKPPLAIEVE